MNCHCLFMQDIDAYGYVCDFHAPKVTTDEDGRQWLGGRRVQVRLVAHSREGDTIRLVPPPVEPPPPVSFHMVANMRRLT